MKKNFFRFSLAILILLFAQTVIAEYVYPSSATGDNWVDPENSINSVTKTATYNLPANSLSDALEFNCDNKFIENIATYTNYTTDSTYLFATINIFYESQWHSLGEFGLRDAPAKITPIEQGRHVEKARIVFRNSSSEEQEIQLRSFTIDEQPAPSPTPTPSPSPTPTPSATPSPTPSATPTPTPTPSPSPTPSVSPTPTPSGTPTPTPSSSPTPTPSVSPTPTPSGSPTPTPTESPSPTPTATLTPTQTPVQTPTQTPVPTSTPTQTPWSSPTATPVRELTTTASNIETWFNLPFEVSLECKAKNTSCTQTRFRVDRTSWQTGNTINIKDDGNHIIEFYSLGPDKLREEIKTVWTGLDSIGPEKPGYLKAFKENESIQLYWVKAIDELSGVKEYVIYKDGAEITRTSETNYLDLEVKKEGEYIYKIKAIDFAGNEGETEQIVVTLTEIKEPEKQNIMIEFRSPKSGENIIETGEISEIEIGLFTENTTLEEEKVVAIVEINGEKELVFFELKPDKSGYVYELEEPIMEGSSTIKVSLSGEEKKGEKEIEISVAKSGEEKPGLPLEYIAVLFVVLGGLITAYFVLGKKEKKEIKKEKIDRSKIRKIDESEKTKQMRSEMIINSIENAISPNEPGKKKTKK